MHERDTRSPSRPSHPVRSGIGRRSSSGSSKTPLIIGLAVLAGLAALATLVIGVAFVYIYSSQQVPVSSEERAELLDIETLAEWVEDFSPSLEFEIVTKTEYWDKTTEISYEYDSPGDIDPYYLMYTIHRERDPSDAWALYGTLWVGTQAGLMLADGEVQIAERNDLFKWGDRSRFGLIQADGHDIGNVFVGTKDETVFYCVFSGVYFDEAGPVSEILLPRLELAVAP